MKWLFIKWKAISVVFSFKRCNCEPSMTNDMLNLIKEATEPLGRGPDFKSVVLRHQKIEKARMKLRKLLKLDEGG